MSAIFADASDSSLALFKEVFEKERKGLSKNNKKRKREQLDLENDKFGDYYDEDSLSSSGGSEPPTPQKAGRLAEIEDDAASWTNSCLSESVQLRLRIFSLLSKACYECPGLLVINLDDLYIDFARRIKELPLSAFSLFISSQATPLVRDAYVSLLRAVIPSFMPSSSPDPWKIDPETDKINGLSVQIMEKCFLPFAANVVGAEANAKLSLLLEAMLRGLWAYGDIPYSRSLAKAVEKGIQARNEKAKKKGARGKGDVGDKAALDILSASSRRLSLLMDVIEAESMDDD
ncbi:putative major facilitator superfamily transporter protein [Phaeoacremonium minimum UCRPA7]|uniref:Putative major facilitator superfamily transporter protein n=1 Tax=Phaeoacremonium minimum (strain UCR-PA7) TaxID=1286976 RepID=R8BQ10_PHAM7|nr:putative major facilitator superfamily transporter protein [Phaeoacremonium minimum UCRPA7]EOO01365.1 putative major facilitator superfamily transporter protein [Phaeoacremonium minimum UCRPA7]